VNASEWIQQLARTCGERLLDEKWLLAPSLRIGHQWVDAVTRTGQAAVNVRIKTLRSMALELAAPVMAAQNLRLLSGQAGPMLIDRVFRRLQSKGLAYLGPLRATTGLAEVIHRSIQAIRMAGLGAEQLASDRFEVDAKGRDVGRILQEYLKEIRRHGLADYAEVLWIAAQQLQKNAVVLPEETIVIVPEDLHVSALEQRLLGVLPDKRKLRLPVDQPVDENAEPEPPSTDVALFRWLPRPTDAPRSVGDGTVEFIRSVGEVNEVRQVLQRLVSAGARVDQAELLYTDAETYAPLVYETLAAQAAEDVRLDDELPVTFAEGIPARFFRPGRLLIAWVAWVVEDFPQSRLVGMIREGLLTAPDLDEKSFSFTRLAAVLRQIGIGFGKDRYLPRLDEEIAARKRRLETSGEADEDDDDSRQQKNRRLARQVEELGVLRRLVAALLDVLPPPGAPQQATLDSATGLLEKLSRSVNKSDNFARGGLVDDITDLRSWLDEDDASGLDVWQWLANLPGQARVLGSGPRPGRLHVASVASGGHSGRPYTFIVGLDDSRFPGAGSQDPLVLDGERQRISKNLPTAVSELEEKIADFHRLLARLRGNLVLSFPGQDLIDDRETFPCPLLLSAYRIVSGDREGSQEDFLQWLPPPASFAPSEDHRCLNISDWWLWQLCSEGPVRDAAGLVLRCFPHLARGSEAMARRLADEFTEYDGRVEVAGNVLDPTTAGGPVMSSARLELIGRCPLAFFFQRGLGIAPPEELELDPARWLDRLAYGSLLHEVFEQFVRQLIDERLLPKYPDHLQRLEAILEARIKSYRKEYPPPNEHAYQGQRAELHRVARTFLTEEAQFCSETGSQPVYLEASLGIKAAGKGTKIDTDEPISIRLPDGSSVRVRGRVDRIDQMSGETVRSYSIWDYKSGSAWKYDQGDPLRQGRVMQPALYVAMVAHRLKEAVSAKARVAQFGFFFPGVRERGRRIQWTPAQLADGENVLGRLVQIVRKGTFVATDNADDCKYCDYRAICRDPEAVAHTTQDKLAGADKTTLQPFRELRGHGEE
jgi:ATP-dependent helicase/nuclease subunit B